MKEGAYMRKCLVLCLIVILAIGVVIGCGEQKQPENDHDIINANMKKMMVPMSKDPYSGIRQAVSKGMPAKGSGYEVSYLDQVNNGETINLVLNQIQLIILPANQTTPYHWSELRIDDKSILNVNFDEYVCDDNPEKMMGVGGHRVYEIAAIAPGKTKLTAVQTHVADEEDVLEEFTLEVVVEE
jgi:predicted secreted protein